jgi:LmbE family N-acetylglucosaminyl deacetylase
MFLEQAQIINKMEEIIDREMEKMNIMVVGAHPDDCDFKCGGTALKFLAAGHTVRFLSMTNGCMGHHLDYGAAMAARRYAETQAVARLTGIEYRVMDIPDGGLMPDLRSREMLLREIRAYKPDIVITHRPNDYHPDHRNTGVLVMDSSYMVIVPGTAPGTPPLRTQPFIFYMSDDFTFPGPFVPDVAVAIDDVMEGKTAMLNCHVSQVYEWLPWADGDPDTVPPAEDKKGRLAWLAASLRQQDAPVAESCRDLLKKRYGEETGAGIQCCEAFQLCEYGRQADEKTLQELFGF